MLSIFKKTGSAAVAAVLSVSWPAAALGAGSSPADAGTVLTGHIPKQLRSATALERFPAGETVALTMVVRLDRELLDRTLAQMYGPKAPPVKRFLSPAEFAQTFDLARKRQALKDFAAGAGLDVVGEDRPGSLVVKVSGSAERVEKAFGVQLRRYRSGDGQVFRANDKDPTIPSSLAAHLNAVLGLSNFRGAKKPHLARWRPAQARPKAASSTASGRAAPAALNGTGASCTAAGQCGLAPADIKSVYGLSGSLNGSGQTVALLELDGYFAGDIGLYESRYGLGSPAVSCKLDGYACPVNNCGPSLNDPCDATSS